jgi:phosphoadenosine phosphosulfate reductase
MAFESSTDALDHAPSAGSGSDSALAVAAVDPARALADFRRSLDGRIVFTTSFGLEDQAITHLIASHGLAIEIATLDTGRLFPETYEVWSRTEARYGLRIRAIYPEAGALEALVASQGIDGFRASIEARKACCAARKVAPLGRLLAGADGWVTGLRADQSDQRAGVPLQAWDEQHRLLKLNPLVSWTRDDAARFAAENGVPVNALHARGFPSIGCAPCTRAIQSGEPERAGRWWWEQEGAKECGLHVGPDGRLVRQAVREARA